MSIPLLRVLRRESNLALYFSGEEDALSFTVWGGDGLQLEEVQQHLDLHREQEIRLISCNSKLLNETMKTKTTKNEWVTCAMTSWDQLSPMLMGCVGLVGILLSFSEGLSNVGPNTVAKLWRDILLTLSFSATLDRRRSQQRWSTGRCLWQSTTFLWMQQIDAPQSDFSLFKEGLVLFEAWIYLSNWSMFDQKMEKSE